MTIHHDHRPGRPVSVDGRVMPQHCAVCGTRIVHHLVTDTGVPAMPALGARLTQVAIPVETFDGGLNCRNCHRPVIAREGSFGLTVHVHTATMDRACTR